MGRSTQRMVSNKWNFYPGFDVSVGIRRLIFNEWMAVSSIRMGRSPSFGWIIMKSIGARQWNFQFNVGRSSGGLTLRHEKKNEQNIASILQRLDVTVKSSEKHQPQQQQ